MVIKKKPAGYRGSVSVIITCYNQAPFLGEAIESALLDQTYRVSEVIVVNDGSSDDTAKVVAQYPEVIYIRQQNRGVVAARNVGLRTAKSDFVVFLDGDDRLRPHALEVGARSLIAHPTAAFVYGRCQRVDADGEPLPTSYEPPVEKDHYAALLQNNFLWMPAMLMHRRRSLNLAGGFSSTADHSSDYDLYLRLSRENSVYGHNEVVADYRLHGANASNKVGGMLKATMRTMRAQRRYIKSDEQLSRAYRTGIIHWCGYYGELLYQETKNNFLGGNVFSLKTVKNLLTVLLYSPRVPYWHLKRVFQQHTTKNKSLKHGS